MEPGVAIAHVRVHGWFGADSVLARMGAPLSTGA